jgi:hypothetical protein
MLPHDFPPWKTVWYNWRGFWERVHAALRTEIHRRR